MVDTYIYTHFLYVYINIWAEVALGLYYKTFLIYRACMRRAPTRPARACFVRTCCAAVVQEHDLRATPVQSNAKRTPSSHFTLRSSHSGLHTSHLHFALHISSHLKSCELFSPYLTSSHLFSSHPISSHMSSKYILLNCFHLIRALINPSHLLEVLLNSSQLVCTPESSYCQREVSCTKNTGRRKLLHTEAWDTDAFTQKSLYKILCTTKPAQSTSQYYFVLQSLHKVLPMEYYFVLQSLRRVLPSTTLYYKACTNHDAATIRRKSIDKSHHRNFDAANPIRFTTLSCKRH